MVTSTANQDVELDVEFDTNGEDNSNESESDDRTSTTNLMEVDEL